jgi:hypothetical protein
MSVPQPFFGVDVSGSPNAAIATVRAVGWNSEGSELPADLPGIEKPANAR